MLRVLTAVHDSFREPVAEIFPSPTISELALLRATGHLRCMQRFAEGHESGTAVFGAQHLGVGIELKES